MLAGFHNHVDAEGCARARNGCASGITTHANAANGCKASMSFPAPGSSVNLTTASPSTVVDMHDVRYQASGGAPLDSINAYGDTSPSRTKTGRHVDDIWKESNTMSTLSGAPPETSHSSITSYSTR